jgi:hypothetical protein
VRQLASDSAVMRREHRRTQANETGTETRELARQAGRRSGELHGCHLPV